MAFPSFNIGTLFRPTQQVQQAPGQQPQPPQGAPNSSLNGAPQQQVQQPGGNGNPQQQDPNNQQQNSPLDRWKDVWNTPTDPKLQQPADPFASPLFQTDPAKIREVAGQMDFVSQVPAELRQRAMSGNDPEAFLAVMNAVAQNSLSTALQLSTATIEQAGSKIGQRFNSSLPGKFKDFQVDNSKPKHSVLSHPAVQPMLKSVRSMIKMHNPDFSVDQINSAAEEYFQGMVTAMSSTNPDGTPKQQQQSPEQGGDMNWETWGNS